MAENKLKNRVGERYESNKYGWFTIIEYTHSKKITIQFDTCGTVVVDVSFIEIRKGQVTPHPRSKTLTASSFLKLAGLKFKWKFTYNVVDEIVNRQSLVEITCRKCKAVKTRKCGDHLDWNGCLECTKLAFAKADEDRKKEAERLSYEKSFNFIQSKVVMLPLHIEMIGTPKTVGSVLEFRCTKHEHTYQTSLQKVINSDSSGCEQCKKENAAKRRWQTVTFDVFKERAAIAHNGAYIYNEETWTDIGSSIEMTHITCGNTFKASCSSHINGNYGKAVGCPYCATHGFSKGREGTMYLLYEPHHNMIKVGITHQAVESRVRQMTTNSIRKYGVTLQWEIIATKYYADGEACLKKEKHIHKILTSAGVQQPSFAFDGKTECFNCKPEVVLKIFNQ